MRSIRLFAVALILGTLLVGTGVASAAGYPFAVLDNSTGTSAVIVGKFASGSGQFTQQEAQNLVDSVVAAVQSTLGSTGGSTILGPSDLASVGYGDADALKDFIKQNYMAAGIDVYIFLDIKRTAQYAAKFGNNIRIDVYVADMAQPLGISADYLYAASIEAPEMYLSLLQSFSLM